MLIFRAIKIAIQISTVFCRASPALSLARPFSTVSGLHAPSEHINNRFAVWHPFGEQAVKDSERLELDWLLKCNVEELIALVRPMSAKNCEQIVRAILDRIGGPTFEQLLTRIIGTMVPRDGRGPPTNSDEY
jgi:hypothetical protein